MVKKVSRADVAREAGVSESTVSRALNNSSLISEPIKQKVQRVAHSLGYYPSRTATLFAKNRSYCIGFVTPNYKKIKPFSRSYFPSLLDGVVEAVTEKSYSVNIVIDENLGRYRSYDELINAHAVDGLIFSITNDNFLPIYSLMDKKLPFVLVNNYFEGSSSIYARPDKGMQKAFQYLYDMGHTQVGYITGDLDFKNGKDRLSNFENLSHQYHMDTKIIKGNFSKTSGYNAFDQFHGNLPSVVMNACDRQAFGFMQACSDNNIIVPSDIQVIGYDDFYPAATSTPSLTTISHPISEMGKVASNLLIDIIEERCEYKQIWFDTDFVIRKSTRKLK